MIRRREFLSAAGRVGTTLLVAPAAGAITSAVAAPATAQPGSGSGFFGQVTSVLDGRPVAGAAVSISSLGQSVTSGADGQYVLPAPPGSYLVQVSANGFVGAIRPDQTVREGYTSLGVDLVPLAASVAQQEAIYAKVVKQIDSPLVSLPQRPLAPLNGSYSLPSTITVRYSTGDVVVPLEDYVKGVVPNEVPANWPMETLKAQAVAARSYGVASYLASGYVYPDTRSQVYNPNNRTTATDAAVDATAGQVLTYGGAVITAFFFSRCNGATTVNSENAIDTRQFVCGSLNWNFVAYCRARACTGHSPSPNTNCGYYGHGVGMCQWGSYYQGHDWGATYDAILASYYTNTTLQNAGISTPTPLGPFLVQQGQSFTIYWASAGSGASYTVSVQPSGGGSAVASYNGPNTSLPVGGLGTGTYSWTVSASLGGQNAGPVAATIRVVDHLNKVYLPVANR